MIASVVIDIKNKQVNRAFDYNIPESFINIIKIGSRVIVPFGKLKRTGYIIEIKESSDYDKKLKNIIEIIDLKPILSKELIDIGLYIAENNYSYYYTCLDQMVPRSLKLKYQRIAIPKNKELLSPILQDLLKRRKELIIDNFNDEIKNEIYNAYKNDLIIFDTKFNNKKDNNIKMVHLNNYNYFSRSKYKNEIIEYLEEQSSDIELDILITDMGFKRVYINELENENAISIYNKEIKDLNDEIIPINNNLDLNEDQKKVFNSIKYNEYKTYLLHGITGSGKTFIYIKWINEILKLGKTALLLVPEISLTPQITSILYNNFKENIAILHSRLGEKERYLEWKKIINNEVKIVVGARSAIFAPINNLGIIIIDEAHEGSYIQMNNPKYDTKEIAKIRAKNYNIPLILGSATPTICDYYYALNGEYGLLTLNKRANSMPLPKVELVDLREELKNGNKSVLSLSLQEKIKECYKNNEQSILFINRRGHSKFVECRNCGDSIKCPRCDVSLTYHENINSLVCHYCGYSMPNTPICPNCGSDKIRYMGFGTEKLVNMVSSMLPEARILKVDLDSVTKMEDYNSYYNKFKNHEADIMIGTQMITKGLDFKDVTLVGIINADLSLHYPIYDANEVSFNLIEQVSGRAGRSEKEGMVVIQSYKPNHFIINCAKNHDYESYYKLEIKNRELTDMPPFSTVILMMIKSKDKYKALNECKHIMSLLKNKSKKSSILGPIEAYPFKHNNIYRYMIQLKIKEDSLLDEIKNIYPVYQNDKDIEIDIRRI